MFSLERGATHYTSNLGYLELRKALSRYVRKQFGAAYNPEDEIRVTVGVSEALDIALRALINPGDEVLFHEPCYVSYGATIVFAHGVPMAVAVSRPCATRPPPAGPTNRGSSPHTASLPGWPHRSGR